MQLSERIKTLRIQERYSQSKLGEIVGVKPNTVWRWENNKAKPDSETIVKIAHALNTSVAFLLGETDTSIPPTEYTKETISEAITTANRIAKQAEQKGFHDAVLGWTNDFFILKKGDTEVRVPITDKTQSILDNFMRGMLNSLVNSTDTLTEDNKQTKSSLVNIRQNNVGRDANFNVAPIPETEQIKK